jgi:hypothetical protein
MDIRELETAERGLISVYVGDLGQFVPFAFSIFSQDDEGRKYVMLCQRKSVSEILKLKGMVAVGTDHLVESLASHLKEVECRDFQEVKSAMDEFIMPGRSSYNLEFEAVERAEVVARLKARVSSELRQAKHRLALISEISAVWHEEKILANC